MGTDKFYEGLRAFGFGNKTGVDFYSESKGILMSQSAVKTVDLARIGFGQAVAVTPLQLISGVCAVVNGGNKVKPHFVESVFDENALYYSFEPTYERVIKQSTSDKMRELLEAVVSEGGGKKGGVTGYRIGGKTGTAQKYESGVIASGKYVSSFVGFAPVDDPKYAILFTVDEPNSYAYYGSIVAAPYVADTFEKIFYYEGVLPAASGIKEYVEMPNLSGLKFDNASAMLKEKGLFYEVEGEGDTIISTLPIAGEKIEKGDVVLIRT
jgi:stage V sporulation protein D (sporulation-specific penicillin-binding protein)